MLSSPVFTAPASTTDEYVQQLETNVVAVLDELAPIRTKMKRKTNRVNSWLTDDASNAKKQRRRLERTWRKTRRDSDRILYRQSCRHANRLIVQSRQDHFKDRLNSANDLKSRWSTVKELLHSKKDAPCIPNDSSGEHFSAVIARYFINKINDLRDVITSKLLGAAANPLEFDRLHTGANLLDLEPVTLPEVEKLLSSMPAKTSPIDVVPTTLLKKCMDIFAPVIVRLANISFAEGKFPTSYTKAQVTPLLKKAGLDANSPINYRPISNLSTISKVLERLFLARLRNHVSCSSSFNVFQSAYRRFHSTETALLKILDEVYNSIDDRKVTCLAALDLSAAFDTIKHGILLDRLRATFGIDGASLQWIRTYLLGRSQTVAFDGVNSPSSPCTLGVPQGSVLGPILFTLFITPVTNVIASHGVSFHQFADDTQLFISVDPKSPNISLDVLNNCSKDVLNWFTHNGLSLNPSKTEVLIMGTRQMVQQVEMSSIPLAGCEIKRCDNLKSLGVVLDDHLSFDKHVSDICKSTSFHTRALAHVRRSITTDMARTVATAIVGSKLDYCNSLLFGASNKNIMRLQRIQNNLARVVTNRGKYDRITPILAELHWLPIRERIEFKLCTLIYKVRTNKQPAYLASCLTESVLTRNLRSASRHLLTVPRTRTVAASRRFSVAAPTVWNRIPLAIRETETLASFRNKLKTFLFKLAYDT